jgi:hypothetical protein
LIFIELNPRLSNIQTSLILRSARHNFRIVLTTVVSKTRLASPLLRATALDASGAKLQRKIGIPK